MLTLTLGGSRFRAYVEDGLGFLGLRNVVTSEEGVGFEVAV